MIGHGGLLKASVYLYSLYYYTLWADCHKWPEGTRQGFFMPAAFSQVDRSRQYPSVRMLEITSQCRPLLWPLICVDQQNFLQPTRNKTSFTVY